MTKDGVPSKGRGPRGSGERLRHLLAELRTLTPSERRARLLDDTSGTSLLDEVVELLDTSDESGASKAPPVSTTFAPSDFESLDETIDHRPRPAATSAHPERVGPYRILEHLGSGGMGDVYLAQQRHPVERRVALKLIRTARRHGSAEARFRAEQQAMARLSHPNVAKLFDAGTSELGFPYFVMELVDGQPLDEFAANRRLDVRARIRVLAEACRGVEHAHRRGILHRDLKPGNLLVEDTAGGPRPRIIDFGVAKALEDPLSDETLTVGWQAVGTPAYMSPEALTGSADLDTRTDVYSLGVLLFEMIVGSHPVPVEGSTKERWRQRLTAGEPPRPSTRFFALDRDEQLRIAEERGTDRRNLVRVLSGDLGWIAWKALAPEREDRYGSARELAEDLEAWLELRPVSAHPPTLGYRIRKLVQRHRVPAIALALVVAAILAGFAGTTVGFVHARAEAERATREARTAREVSDFLAQLFEVSDPRENLGETITARELLDRGADRILSELADEPRTQARLMAVMGRVYTQLGLLDDAEGLLREAVEREKSLGADDLDAATVFDHLGQLLYKQNANEEAGAMFERALEIRRRELGVDHATVGDTLQKLGDVAEQQGRPEDATRALEEALRIQVAALGPDDLAVAETLSRLAVVAGNQDQFERALDLGGQALAIREKVLGPEHLDVAQSLNELAGVLYGADRWEEAHALLQRSLSIREAILGPDHPNVAQCLNNLAATTTDHDQALLYIDRARAIWEKVLGPENPRLMRLYDGMGNHLRALGRLDEALMAAERSYELSLHPDVGKANRVGYAASVAEIHLDAGRPGEAEAWWRRGLADAAAAGVGDDARQVQRTLRELADFLRQSDRTDEADDLEARILEGLQP